MHNNDPSDIDVDWFYKGKRRGKHSGSSSNTHKDRLKEKEKLVNKTAAKTQPAAQTTERPQDSIRLSIPSTHATAQEFAATLSPASSVASATSATPPSTQLNQPAPAAAPPHSSSTQTSAPSSGRSLLSKALRPRANSDSKAKVSQAILSPPQTAYLAPSTSASAASSSTLGGASTHVPQPQASSISRSNSLQNKPKKTSSLFSVFSKKKPPPPTSPLPIRIPTSASSSVASSPATLPALGSSLESLSPRVEYLAKVLFPASNEHGRVVLNKNPNRSSVPIKELTDVRLRRVTFALDKLPDDPPQQIPSRNPKKGNITVIDDIIGEPLKLSIGITNEAKTEQKHYDEKELRIAKDLQRRSLEEAEKHAQEAHKAAQRIANEVVNYKNKHSKFSSVKEEDEFDEKILTGVSELEIDKPIHLHEQHFEDEVIHSHEDDDHEISLEQIYTRCCHLREILPIPATLKQLKNKTSPLQTLKLLNPKPTLIDVYSFSDFIAIVPIKNVIFDNVTMSTEMLKIILSSLVRSSTVQRLSLRNVPIDDAGWKFLCKFLSRNKSIIKLDVSQQKIKPELALSQHRSEMDWSLFVDTLILRGGIEELILNGCKLSFPVFGRLIDEGVSRSTKRLGVSQMDLSLEHMKVLSNWLSLEGSTCEGLDIGYNDLNLGEKLKPLIKKVQHAHNLQCLSINSTNLTNVEDVALLVRSLSKLSNLRFLDLSNLAPVFPGILPYLNKYLPRFPNLNRIHLDGNDLSTKSFSILAEIIPKCENLVHVSITGSTTISYAASAAMYSAAKASKSLIHLDLDYDLIDEKISSRIAVCLMRNMQSSMHESDHGDTHDDILFDGTLIAETASKLLDKITTTSDLEKDDFAKKFLKKQFLDKISNTREKINKTMDELMYKRDHDEKLTLVEKEDLLRFYFLDTSLANILEIFENLPDDESSTTTPTIAVTQALPISAPQPQADIQPHQMALEVNGGKATPIDAVTGRPIFLRSLSQTSVQAKKQEEEEGEFHRWGFFVQQQRQMLPRDIPMTDPKTGYYVPQLPSGTELRDAVIKAKGIESISSLIDNVNQKRFDLQNIYPVINEDKSIPIAGVPSTTTAGAGAGAITSTTTTEIEDDAESLQSGEADDIQEVDEAYDKLLNDLSRVRSNK